MLFKTDLEGFITQVKNNNIFNIGILILAVVLTYCFVKKWYDNPNKFTNIMILKGTPGQQTCKNDIPKIDEAIIRNMIELPNRDPQMLTTSMVIPEITTSQEMQKQTRMEILNMFYNTFDDDITSVKSRPQGLYLIP